MKRLTVALACACAFTASAASAQQITREVEAQVRTAVKEGNFSEVVTLAEQTCSRFRKDSIDPSKKVHERADSARQALDCIRRFTASTAASASIVNRAFPTQAALETVEREFQRTLAEAESQEEFLGLKWGLGIGFSVRDDELIDDAELVGGLVQPTSDIAQQPRALLEFHKFFGCNKGGRLGTRGCGPFVAVAASPERVLSGVAMGLMYGFKQSATDSDGFSIGAGAIMDGKIKSLADGFVPGQPPPNGETTIRFITKSRWSFLVFTTRTF